MAQANVTSAEHDRSNPLYFLVDAIELLELDEFAAAKRSVQGSSSTDFQPHTTAYPVPLVERATEKLAAATKSLHGGPSAKRRKTLRRTQSPPEGLTSMIQRLSLDRRIAPPPLPMLVIEKPLSATDLNPHHSRLSIPISQIQDNFLTEEEKQRLRPENKPMNHLPVKIMEVAAPKLYDAKLSRWDMPKPGREKMSSMYAIHGMWNGFVRKTNPAVGMVIQLWFFRFPEELCFALIQLPASASA